MSEQPTSPLQQARLAIQKLREAATVDPVELKTELAAIEALLQQAAVRAEGESAEELRARLESTVDQFARLNSLMVHEIRKPMTSIRGYSDMLAKPGMVGTLNEMQQNFMDVIRKNVIGMEGLVTNISDLNKIVAGRLRLDLKSAALVALVVGAIALGLYSWRRYHAVLERAEAYGAHSSCPACRTYARFEILASGHAAVGPFFDPPDTPLPYPWLRVRCRQCGTVWRMPD